MDRVIYFLLKLVYLLLLYKYFHKMKPFVLVFLAYTFFSVGYPQSRLEIGTNHLTGETITAREFVFPQRIYKVSIDTFNFHTTFLLRATNKKDNFYKDTGEMIYFDLNNSRAIWKRNIAYSNNSFLFGNNKIIISLQPLSQSINTQNGQNLWQVKNGIIFIDDFCNVGVGYDYKVSRGLTNDLLGINLENGKVIWSRKIPRDFGWTDVKKINDSTVIIIAGGLHYINLKDGSGWSYQTITGDKDYSGTVLANTAGIALGLLTGAFFITTGYDLVRDISSNLLIDSNGYFFASKEKVLRISNEGIVNWEHSLPNDLASNSEIFLNGDTLYMINKGYALKGSNNIVYGVPFFAAFNKNSGERLFISTIIEDKIQIVDYWFQDSSLFLLTGDRIFSYNIKNGGIIGDFDIKANLGSDAVCFTKANIYYKKGGEYFSLRNNLNARIPLMLKDEQIILFDEEFNILDSIGKNSLMVNYLEFNNYKFLFDFKQNFILNADNIIIAEIKIEKPVTKHGSRFFIVHDRGFLEIDLFKLFVN
jgi:outer membrane protein assembly factor BamB